MELKLGVGLGGAMPPVELLFSTFSRWASYYGDVPLYSIADPDDRPSPDDFSPDLGLCGGTGTRSWTDTHARSKGSTG